VLLAAGIVCILRGTCKDVEKELKEA